MMTEQQRKIITNLYFKHLSNYTELKHTHESKTEYIPEEYTLYTIDKKYIADLTFDHDHKKQGLLITDITFTHKIFDIHDPNYDTKAAKHILNIINQP